MAWFGGFTLETHNRIPGEYEAVTVGAAAVGLSAGKIKPENGPYAHVSARAALISLEEGDIRFRLDGAPPTADDGHYLTVGDTLVLTGTQALEQFQAMRAGEASGNLRVTYFY
jgi:hypothetical protein